MDIEEANGDLEDMSESNEISVTERASPTRASRELQDSIAGLEFAIRREGWLYKNHNGEPYAKTHKRRWFLSDGFHVEYFEDEARTRRTGRFDLRNVVGLGASTEVARGLDFQLSESKSGQPSSAQPGRSRVSKSLPAQSAGQEARTRGKVVSHEPTQAADRRWWRLRSPIPPRRKESRACCSWSWVKASRFASFVKVASAALSARAAKSAVAAGGRSLVRCVRRPSPQVRRRRLPLWARGKCGAASSAVRSTPARKASKVFSFEAKKSREGPKGSLNKIKEQR